jgi:hypothetical protein
MANRTSSLPTTFGNAHGVVRTAADDWFDPKLHTDTDLFIDPFLMFEETTGPWATIHDQLIDFFNTALEHVAKSGGSHTAVEWRRAAAMLSFPETPQFCLGYGRKTIFGSGSGSGLGLTMLDAAERAIQAGLNDIDDFGELMLFGAGFGADRISDMVCNIAKPTFIDYTKDVTARHGIATTTLTLDHVGFDFSRDRWRRGKVDLPVNNCWAPAPGVILVPERFLDELPKMEDGAFWDWVYTDRNEELRHDLGYEVTRNMKKKDILAMARGRATLRWKYGISYATRYRTKPPKPYDFVRDPGFKVTPLATAQEIAADATVAAPVDPNSFCDFVGDLVLDFKHVVEERAWRSFWEADAIPRSEARVQELFHTSVFMICKMLDVDISPESDAGRGPVDFKFSTGWAKRALVELKFAKSSSFWNNLEKQTPTYLKAEGVQCGFIVIVQHEDAHCTSEFMKKVRAVVKDVAKTANCSYEPVFVDVRSKPSASKIKRTK